MEIEVPAVGLAGYYRLVVYNEDHTIANDTGFFKNVITNQGLDYLGTAQPNGQKPSQFYCVGTGSTAAANTDTQLQASIASAGTDAYSAQGIGGSDPNYYAYYAGTRRFNPGTINNTIREVGVGRFSNGTGLFSRSLLPAPVAVAANQYLDLTYEFRMYPQTNDVTGTTTLNGISRSYTLRAAMITNGGGWDSAPITFLGNGWDSNSGRAYNNVGSGIAARTNPPTGSYADPGNTSDILTLGNYVNGTYERQLTIGWSINRGQVYDNNIGAVVLSANSAAFQMGFTPVLVKGGTRQLTLTWKFKWARRP